MLRYLLKIYRQRTLHASRFGYKIMIIFHFKRLSQQLQRLFCLWLYVAILLFVGPASAYSLCAGDFDADGDVDGRNLFELISSKKGVVASFFNSGN